MSVTATRLRCQWTPEEDRILLWEIGAKPIAEIATTLGRSTRAIQNRAYEHHKVRLRRIAMRQQGMGIGDVAAALGTSIHRVRKWMLIRWIRAWRVPSGTALCWTTSHEEVRRFLFERGGLVPNLHPDVYWRDLYNEARAALQARYITDRALAALLCLSRQSLNRLRKDLGLPYGSLVLSGCVGNYVERAAVVAWLNEHPQYWTAAARQELEMPR